MDKEKLILNTADQIINRGNLGKVDQFFTNDYIAHAEDKEYRGHEFIKRYSQLLRTSIPDITVKDIKFIAESKKTITWQRKLQGTHIHELMGIPATNKKVKWYEMVVSRLEGGQDRRGMGSFRIGWQIAIKAKPKSKRKCRTANSVYNQLLGIKLRALSLLASLVYLDTESLW